jgi:hypothetical protein
MREYIDCSAVNSDILQISQGPAHTESQSHFAKLTSYSAPTGNDTVISNYDTATKPQKKYFTGVPTELYLLL